MNKNNLTPPLFVEGSINADPAARPQRWQTVTVPPTYPIALRLEHVESVQPCGPDIGYQITMASGEKHIVRSCPSPIQRHGWFQTRSLQDARKRVLKKLRRFDTPDETTAGIRQQAHGAEPPRRVSGYKSAFTTASTDLRVSP